MNQLPAWRRTTNAFSLSTFQARCRKLAFIGIRGCAVLRFILLARTTSKKRSRALLLHFAGPDVQDIYEDLTDPEEALPEDQRTPAPQDNGYLKCKWTMLAHISAAPNRQPTLDYAETRAHEASPKSQALLIWEQSSDQRSNQGSHSLHNYEPCSQEETTLRVISHHWANLGAVWFMGGWLALVWGNDHRFSFINDFK